MRLDALLAARLLKGTENLPVTRGGGAKRKKTVRKRAPSDKPNGFNKEMQLLAGLAQLVGAERLGRPQIVKQLWVYIREHNLQNPEDKRQIVCDEVFQRLFKKSTLFEAVWPRWQANTNHRTYWHLRDEQALERAHIQGR